LRQKNSFPPKVLSYRAVKDRKKVIIAFHQCFELLFWLFETENQELYITIIHDTELHEFALVAAILQ